MAQTYYFHLRGEVDRQDTQGMVLPSAEQAHAEAIRLAQSILAEEVCKGRLPLNSVIEVTDDAGSRSVFVAFREAVQIDPDA